MKFKLTLDRKATYRITVPGEIRQFQLGISEMQITYHQSDQIESGFSVMTSAFDQADLYGFLRRLYAMGIPLIEVVCMEYKTKTVRKNAEGEK